MKEHFLVWLYGTFLADTAFQQLQPWNTTGVSPCMEKMSGPPIPTRIGNYYQTPRPLPWRPTMGYENVEVVPL
jgi:tektin-3